MSATNLITRHCTAVTAPHALAGALCNHSGPCRLYRRAAVVFSTANAVRSTHLPQPATSSRLPQISTDLVFIVHAQGAVCLGWARNTQNP
jgi:hypothetical protein